MGLCVLAVALLSPAPAVADGLQFSGRSGTQLWVTCVPEVGCRPYRIAGTVTANVYASSPPDARPAADASFGIFYSTAALGPDTLLVYGFEYRKRGGNWRQVCVNGRCLFDSRKQSPWPGEPAGGNYFQAHLPIRRLRNIQQIKLLVKPLTETSSGRFVGRLRTKTFDVRYYRCTTCALPSTADITPNPDPEQPPKPSPPPAPKPPPPALAPPQDVCAGHTSDPSVVCVRNQGHTVDVCDRDPDGHRAYARVITEQSSPAFLSPYYDDNDSKPGCANLTFPSRVLAVAACVQFEGCSTWRRT